MIEVKQVSVDEKRLQNIRIKYHDWRRVDMEDLDMLYDLSAATYGQLRYEKGDIYAKVLRCMPHTSQTP